MPCDQSNNITCRYPAGFFLGDLLLRGKTSDPMSFLSDFKYGFAIPSYDHMKLKDGQLKSFIALVVA